MESTSALLTGSISGNSLIVEYRRRKNLLDVQFTIESTANFDIWTPLTAPAPAIHDNNDGTETVIVTDTAPFPAGGRRFLHLRVALQPTP